MKCSPSRKEWTKYLLSGGNYFPFLRDLLWILSPQESVLLLNLIDLDSYENSNRDESGEWFQCTVKYLENSINYSPDVQTETLRSLVQKGFICSKKKGLPPTRWICISTDMIEEHLWKVKTEKRKTKESNSLRKRKSKKSLKMQSPSNDGHCSPSTIQKTPREYRTGPILSTDKQDLLKPNGFKKTTPSENDEFQLGEEFTDPKISHIQFSIASMLADKIKKDFPDRWDHKSSVKKWALHIRDMERLDKRLPEDMLEVLEWYLPLMGKSMIPEVFSGESFRSKWGPLTTAKKKYEDKHKPRFISASGEDKEEPFTET